jgi:hypothetical protein
MSLLKFTWTSQDENTSRSSSQRFATPSSAALLEIDRRTHVLATVQGYDPGRSCDCLGTNVLTFQVHILFLSVVHCMCSTCWHNEHRDPHLSCTSQTCSTERARPRTGFGHILCCYFSISSIDVHTRFLRAVMPELRGDGNAAWPLPIALQIPAMLGSDLDYFHNELMFYAALSCAE